MMSTMSEQVRPDTFRLDGKRLWAPLETSLTETSYQIYKSPGILTFVHHVERHRGSVPKSSQVITETELAGSGSIKSAY